MKKQLFVFSIALALTAGGMDTFAQDEVKEDSKTPEAPAGILPIPDYSDDIWNRKYLTGDWGGKRTEWANKGLQFDVDNVNWADTVVDGGDTGRTEVGGNFQYNLKWDLMRAGILPGALIQVRAESRYGSSGITNTGQITPNNMAALSPTNYSDFDAGYDIALSQLSYLQMFSEHFGVIAGKLDMYGEGAPNEFAGGRGRTQFMNWNLNVSTPALFVPASTLGAGVVVLPNKNLTITSLLLNGVQCTHSNCFDVLGDNGGLSVNTASFQYNIGGLPGGVNASLFYFFDANFSDLGSIGIIPGDGVLGLVGSNKSDSWQTSVSFWQYVSVEGSHEGPLDLTNKQPDLKGWGVFGSLSFADPDTNPWQTSVAFGVGGRGIVPGRPNDLFGAGGFYNDLATDRLLPTAGFARDYAGTEVFYNLAITPAVRLSTNIQYLPSVEPDVDDSLMISGRFQVIF